MPYPQVSAPYGLKPINLIGGQVFAGSTRNEPIQYGYATNIFYGDFVVLSRGFITRAAVSTGTGANQVTGIFLGVTYTSPLTKQKLFSQYWPAGTLSGDAQAIICDDPDTVFKAVVCSSGTNLASGALAMVGTNLSMVDNTGNTSTGNSANAVLAPTATPASSILPVRCIGVVPDTAYSFTATGSSSSTTITLTGTGAPQAIPVGTGVAYLAANGQVIETGSFVTVAASAGATSVTINAAIAVPGAVTAIPSGATIIFTVYPEILVKVNLLVHGYYSSTTA
ncbi:hypothetical protein UFOVP393_31 [uncultured Caudovirales phage]|uniref:Uncharacterized protein n=1 Tax=uncultured Caudovirales phage TaxID=2100421 RepID=A0A6J7X1J9_9CAUD|nr:hypothetical protein UFOVP393_31 [uncultured Caudovirales phage]